MRTGQQRLDIPPPGGKEAGSVVVLEREEAVVVAVVIADGRRLPWQEVTDDEQPTRLDALLDRGDRGGEGCPVDPVQHEVHDHEIEESDLRRDRRSRAIEEPDRRVALAPCLPGLVRGFDRDGLAAVPRDETGEPLAVTGTDLEDTMRRDGEKVEQPQRDVAARIEQPVAVAPVVVVRLGPAEDLILRGRHLPDPT